MYNLIGQQVMPGFSQLQSMIELHSLIWSLKRNGCFVFRIATTIYLVNDLTMSSDAKLVVIVGQSNSLGNFEKEIVESLRIQLLCECNK